MKNSLVAVLSLTAGVVTAEPGTPSLASVTTDADDGHVKLVYSLPGSEAAIVTLAVTAGGKTYEVGETVGAVNRRVEPGEGLVLHWYPKREIPAGVYAADDLSFQLKAWSLATPPDYMAVSLLDPSCVRYYASSNAVPGGVADSRWKEDWMLLRRIPAKGVTWRAGCAANDYCWNASEQTADRGFQALRYVTSTADFYLGVYEVTQAQYMRLSGGVNPSAVQKGHFTAQMPHYALHQTDWKWHPAEQVTWTLADTAVTKLAEASGLGFSLPTADDWEFAARGETQWGTYNGSPHDPTHISPIGVNYQVQDAYYGGSQADGKHPEYACHLPVGQKRPNKYGLYDMVGNVGEWCSGWFDAGQTKRPIKGGDLHMSGEGLGVGYTRGMAAGTANFKYGFRVACTIP